MFGLPFLKLRWLVAAAVVAGGWTYVNEPAAIRSDAPRKQERVVPRAAAPRPQAALPARVALPEKRPAKAASPRTSDLVTAAIPKAPIPSPRTPAPAVPVPPSKVAAAPKGPQPLRKPQPGDCQCPYDLMIDGSACGEGSAYVRLKRPLTACYR